jgi:hypothetical protein
MKFRRNDAGFDQLRTSAATDAWAKSKAETMAELANAVPSTTDPAATEPYYEVVEWGDEHRAKYLVRATSPRARRHETKTQALLRARAAMETNG